MAYRDNFRSKKSDACGPLGLSRLPGWKESKPEVPGHKETSPREGVEDGEDAESGDDDAYSDHSRSGSSSAIGPPDTRQSYQRQKMGHFGAPTAQMLPGQLLAAGTQANDGVDRRSPASVSRPLSEIASDVDPSDERQGQSGRTASKHAQPAEGEVDHNSKRPKHPRKVISLSHVLWPL